MNGKLPLRLNDRQFFFVYGGPYKLRPAKMVGVKMAIEIDRPFDIEVPTVDFQVPAMEDMIEGIDKAVTEILKGKPLYVGCMGGIGRTGLFLACLAKVFGEKDPVLYVRKHYIPHAVETMAQQKFVANFNPKPWTLRKIKIAGFFLRISRKNLLTKG
ncbi:tyrosine phosphatase family protein [Stenotrophomonas phage vB_SmaS_DLP_5]|uniref:Tyrosine phosphatase family protein n=1 Tax=Stenotrophomonas phage vB_SmaS_DLP_5 TaxID=2044561 RepID=A0A2D2W2H6_9CAUD|nr:thymidylate synthase [Stenotrophomonas phage vB_SmaS_DLP_5]ATS92338.1 tyrosine phosphatase family protein [Stenotrophomonas phage vB_SmaS_DLP_5]